MLSFCFGLFCLDDRELDFPTDYPTSVLLGCVDVIDCLDRESYEEQYPGGESECEYVFICENPQELMFKLPMRGHQKICKSKRLSLLFYLIWFVFKDKLDNQAHQAAKKILLRRTD